MTTKTTGHTPGPWYHATRKDKRESIILDSALTPEGNIPKGTNWIASVYPVSTENDHIANAAFIVRACNSHDALVSALQSLFEHCAMVHKCWGDGDNTKEADAAIKSALAAIKSATGQG